MLCMSRTLVCYVMVISMRFWWVCLLYMLVLIRLLPTYSEIVDTWSITTLSVNSSPQLLLEWGYDGCVKWSWPECHTAREWIFSNCPPMGRNKIWIISVLLQISFIQCNNTPINIHLHSTLQTITKTCFADLLFVNMVVDSAGGFNSPKLAVAL